MTAANLLTNSQAYSSPENKATNVKPAADLGTKQRLKQVWYENSYGMRIGPALPTFVARTECHITCLRLSGGKIIV